MVVQPLSVEKKIDFHANSLLPITAAKLAFLTGAMYNFLADVN